MTNTSTTWLELRVLREKDGQTLSGLAARAVDPVTGRPMSVGHLSDLEAGKRQPTPSVIKRLARALNVPVSVLEKHQRGEAA